MLEKLIQRLQNELYSKELPGDIILDLRDKWIDIFLNKYECDIEALTLGFILADYKLQEATMLNKSSQHIRMAVTYADQILEKYEVTGEKKDKIIEIIQTHNGGEQKYLESKLFMNACSISYLEPKGWLNLFNSIYKTPGELFFHEALDKTIKKIEEKKELINLDDETINEAEKLYSNFMNLINRIKSK